MAKSRLIPEVLLMTLLLGGILFFIPQCKQKPAGHTEDNGSQKTVEPRLVAVPPFDADSAYDFVATQVAFGPRIPGTPAQEQCADWLIAKLKQYTPDVVVQDVKIDLYTKEKVPCKNIIASFNPGVKKRILLCAHWDTRPWSDRDSLKPKAPFDGADDGGSGVGILLEIARQLSKQPTQVGIDVIFFDVEDYGPADWDPQSKSEEINGYCLGTQHWADDPHEKDYRAYYGILLDMVGAKNATFYQEGISMQYAPSVVQKVWGIAQALGYSNYFINEAMPGIIDDHSFINHVNGTPCIDIINMSRTSGTGFARHWHTQADNMNIIDKATLKAVGETLMQVIYSEPATTS